MNLQMIGGTKWMGAALIVVAPVLACSRGEPETAFAGSVSSTRAAAVQAVKPATAAVLRFVLAPTGNTARYRVRERLVGHDLPNDAIGETKSLTGAIEFDSKGKVIPQSSKFILNAGTFVSDQNRRDGFVRGRLLEADAYPSIVLVPTDISGVSLPLPASGTLPFEMTANLTVHGVTRPTIWKGSAKFQDGRVTGSAATAFTFDDIQMEQPRVPVLLSVADTIRLEMDFDLIRQP
jgi:polyisoprenoid-binding protein YceI